jgi:hypothetical protein
VNIGFLFTKKLFFTFHELDVRRSGAVRLLLTADCFEPCSKLANHREQFYIASLIILAFRWNLKNGVRTLAWAQSITPKNLMTLYLLKLRIDSRQRWIQIADSFKAIIFCCIKRKGFGSFAGMLYFLTFSRHSHYKYLISVFQIRIRSYPDLICRDRICIT